LDGLAAGLVPTHPRSLCSAPRAYAQVKNTEPTAKSWGAAPPNRRDTHAEASPHSTLQCREGRFATGHPAEGVPLEPSFELRQLELWFKMAKLSYPQMGISAAKIVLALKSRAANRSGKSLYNGPFGPCF